MQVWEHNTEHTVHQMYAQHINKLLHALVRQLEHIYNYIGIKITITLRMVDTFVLYLQPSHAHSLPL